MTIRWGLGPAFYYEWLITSRRWQTYAGRCLFVGILLAGLTLVWISRVHGEPITSMHELANVGEAFFNAIAGIQLTLVLLAAPAYAAGAICLDKTRGVLTHLMVTDLSDTEIVLGKLAARLLLVLGVLFVTLPVLALATLLGGIAPEALLSSFLVSLGTSILCCSLALTLSVFGQKTHEVLLATYLFEVAGLLVLPICSIFTGMSPSWMQTTNPYWLAFAPYTHPETSHINDYLSFLGLCVSISTLLVVLAICSIRPLTTGQAFHRQRLAILGIAMLLLPVILSSLGASVGAVLGVVMAVMMFLPIGIAIAVKRGQPPSEKDSRNTTPDSFALRRESHPFVVVYRTLMRGIPPSLEDNPVLWCEWRSRRASGWMRVIGLIYVMVAGIFALLAIGEAMKFWRIDRELPALVNAGVVALGLLLLSVYSVTAMAEDRSRGTLEILLMTPLKTRHIVFAKWWATFRRVPGLLLVPGVIGLIVGLWHGTVGMVIVLLLLVLSYGAAVTSLGLALATWIKRAGWAIAASVTAYVMVTVGWVFALLALVSTRNDDMAQGLALASPFWGPGLLTVGMEESFRRSNELLGWAALWIIVYLVVAAILLKATVLSFDRCLGRMNQAELTD